VRSALLHVAGMVAGDLAYLLFAVWGLSLVAQALGGLFWLLRLAGGAYLIFLGVRVWRSGAVDETQGKSQQFKSAGSVFAGGLAVSLSNPKVILFYCGFLPAFFDLRTLGLPDLAVVVGVMSAILFGVLAAYAALAGAARRMLSGSGARRWLNRAAGGALAAAGVAIAVRR
jgi:threonine/homoserine/homoserine lactone efflux protein